MGTGTLFLTIHYVDVSKPDAVVHCNPLFCCPGVVSSAIFDRLREKFSIPIINIFYDGTGDPNQILKPYLYFLQNRKNSN